MKKNVIILILILFALLTLVLAPVIGIKIISPKYFFRPFHSDIDAYIFWNIRMPRVLTAFLAGSALSVSGMAFQAMFRNPLATPFTLGLASGASFGATIYMWGGFSFAFLGISGISICSFLGSLLSILLVYGVTRVKKGFSTATMLLTGVAVSFFFSSLILFIQYISDFTQSFQIIRWLMGSLEIVGFSSFFNLLPFVVVGIAIIFYLVNELNLLISGEDVAVSRGANIRITKTVLFLATSLMISGVVSTCGPIAFVGMISPHICRLIIGTNHKYLAPASFIFGGMFLALCDIVSRTVIAPAEIPVGVITALLGGPFFLWLLLGGSSERSILEK